MSSSGLSGLLPARNLSSKKIKNITENCSQNISLPVKVFVPGLVQTGERALSHEWDSVRPSTEPLVPDLVLDPNVSDPVEVDGGVELCLVPVGPGAVGHPVLQGHLHDVVLTDHQQRSGKLWRGFTPVSKVLHMRRTSPDHCKWRRVSDVHPPACLNQWLLFTVIHYSTIIIISSTIIQPLSTFTLILFTIIYYLLTNDPL